MVGLEKLDEKVEEMWQSISMSDKILLCQCVIFQYIVFVKKKNPPVCPDLFLAA
jgi:hypothetical protein